MTIDVEQVVREVVAELERRQRAEAAPSDTSACSVTPTAKVQTPSKQNDRELVIGSRVVSLAEIGDRLGHIRRLVVPPGAIVTPAARDALADRNVTIDFNISNTETTVATSQLLIIAARTKYEPASLVAGLQAQGLNVETQTSECLIRSADMLAEYVVDSAKLGVVLTHDMAAALCLANRFSGVRAVAAANRAEAIDAARAVGANVLITNPRGKGVFQLKQMIAEFCCLGPWVCPEPLRARLM